MIGPWAMGPGLGQDSRPGRVTSFMNKLRRQDQMSMSTHTHTHTHEELIALVGAGVPGVGLVQRSRKITREAFWSQIYFDERQPCPSHGSYSLVDALLLAVAATAASLLMPQRYYPALGTMAQEDAVMKKGPKTSTAAIGCGRERLEFERAGKSRQHRMGHRKERWMGRENIWTDIHGTRSTE